MGKMSYIVIRRLALYKYAYALLSTLSLCGLAASPAVADSDAIRDFWFNGAEINHYELEQVRYGESHPGHVEFIFVTEPFLIEAQVKHEHGDEPSVDVLKLNALRTFNTDIYSYRTMTSTFSPLDIDSYPHALKSTTSVQDWCGQVFQQINRKDAGWNVQLYSYFQNEGDIDVTLPNVWLEDELWTRVRIAPESLPVGKFQLLPAALALRFNHLALEPLQAEGSLTVEGEHYIYTLNYEEIKRRLVIRFDTSFPHIIRSWEEHEPQAGLVTRAVLKDRVMNSYYWKQNSPEDRSKRKSLGLAPIAD